MSIQASPDATAVKAQVTGVWVERWQQPHAAETTPANTRRIGCAHQDAQPMPRMTDAVMPLLTAFIPVLAMRMLPCTAIGSAMQVHGRRRLQLLQQLPQQLLWHVLVPVPDMRTGRSAVT